MFYQYFVCPPLFSKTAWTLLGMLSTSRWHIAFSWSSWYHTWTKAVMMFFLEKAECALRRSFMIAQRFSNGFKSGEFGGQVSRLLSSCVRRSSVRLLTWQGALSCWNTQFPSGLLNDSPVDYILNVTVRVHGGLNNISSPGTVVREAIPHHHLHRVL